MKSRRSFVNFTDPSQLKVAVLAGGTSGEREVSLRSGEGVATTLRGEDVDVTVIDPANTADLAQLFNEAFDAAFLALHGGLGEDGSIQGLLQVSGIPYTGPGVWSSATAMDKGKSKPYYADHGLLFPQGLVVTSSDHNTVLHLTDAIGFPCMIKPVDGGSSLGLNRANDPSELKSGLANALSEGPRALVENYIEGDLFTAGVLGNDDDLIGLPIVWLAFEGECDYDAKYGSSGRLQHICPAPNLSDQEVQRIQELAMSAHRALECSGVSRSDFIRDKDGRFWILETNTLPGMTPTSSLPTAAKAAGISYPDLCLMLLDLAIGRSLS